MTEPTQGHWRRMRPDDIAAVTAISDAVHGAYTEEAAVYRERLDLYPDGCFAYEQGNAVTGYLISHPWLRGVPPRLGARLGALPAGADTYYLHDVALLPQTQGGGAGRKAIALVRNQARAAGLHDVTLTAVHGADGFWAAQGFAYIGGGEAAYGPGTHLMRLPLDG